MRRFTSRTFAKAKALPGITKQRKVIPFLPPSALLYVELGFSEVPSDAKNLQEAVTPMLSRKGSL